MENHSLPRRSHFNSKFREFREGMEGYCCFEKSGEGATLLTRNLILVKQIFNIFEHALPLHRVEVEVRLGTSTFTHSHSHTDKHTGHILCLNEKK